MYGINAYKSNAMYTSLLSSNYSKKSYAQTNSTSDLLALMKKVDQVRSKDYQKNMIKEYEKAFSNSDVGTYESEKKLASDATDLGKSASVLASASKADFEDKDKLVSNVKSFVEDYNSVVDSLQKSESVDEHGKGLLRCTRQDRLKGRFGQQADLERGHAERCGHQLGKVASQRQLFFHGESC